MVNEDSFLNPSPPRPQVESSPRREADEIDPVCLQTFQLNRQQREPRGKRGSLLICDVQAIEVLLSNRRIGTDIENVNALDVFRLETLHHLGNNATGNHRLAKANLVSYEESPGRRVVEVHPIEDVIDCSALKVLQTAHRGIDINSLRAHSSASGNSESNIFQRSMNSAGITSRPWVVSLSCSTSFLTERRRLGLRL